MLHKSFLNKTQKAEHLSEAYSIVSVGEAILPLLESGYSVLDSKVNKVLDPKRDGLQKHLIRLVRTSDIENKELTEFPTLNVMNAHDGTSALRIEFGIYRIVCANGMWAGQAFESYRLTHRGKSLQDKVNDVVPGIAANHDKVLDFVTRLKAKTPSQSELDFLASEAIRLRDKYTFENASSEIIDGLIHWLTHSNFRYQDKGSDLWTVFNRIQEFTIRGTKRNRLPKLDAETGRIVGKSWRALNSLDTTRRINQELSNAAEYILEGKVA